MVVMENKRKFERYDKPSGMFNITTHKKNWYEIGLTDISAGGMKFTSPATFDVNDESLVAPIDMKEAVLSLLKDNPPNDDIELFASIYHSLALCYKKAIDELENITNKTFSSICVVGGGAKNKFLNNLIEQYTGKTVVALPIEATALGNIKIQMKVS
jgi:hypothetical protein